MANSSLTLSRSSFSNNSASTAGGAVLVLDSAQVSCSGRCNFSSNSAALGGAIAVQSGSVSLSDAVLGGNYASAGLVTVMFGNSQQRAGSGGAVFAANATLKLSRSILQGNRAEVQGGALQLLSTAAVLTATRLINNMAAPASAQHSTGPAAAAAIQADPTAGGAILVGLLPPAAAAASTNSSSSKPKAHLTLHDCVLSSNMAGFGGAIAAVDTAVSLEAGAAAAAAAQGVRSAGRADTPLSILLAGCSVSNNSAAVAGGGVFTNLRSTSLTLNSIKVTGNTAAQGGGGIAAVTPASLQLASSSVSSNTASYCAGLLLDSPALKSVLHSSSFERNTAGQQSVDGRSFGQLPQWNSTGSGGGLCIIPGGPVAITKSRITQNTALFGGEAGDSGSRMLLQHTGVW
jgi:predicted outer membrane repeat protein